MPQMDEESIKKIEKEKRIRKERNKLRKKLKESGADLQALEGLIDNTSWMKIELEDMRKDIDENGREAPFQQSANVPPYMRERPVVGEYMKLSKDYESKMKVLLSYLPHDDDPTAADEFQAFLRRG